MTSKHILLAYLPNIFWSAPLVRAVQENTALSGRVSELQKEPLRELSLAVTTKIKILEEVVERFDRHLAELNRLLREDEARVREFIGKTNSAYCIKRADLPFQLVLDIDAFLYESRSAYEIFGRFVREFCARILGEAVDEEGLKNLLNERGLDTAWIEELREDRINFFHGTAPWIAGRKISDAPLRFELVTLRQDTSDLSNPSTYIDLAELHRIYQGFTSARHAILNELVAKVQNYKGNPR